MSAGGRSSLGRFFGPLAGPVGAILFPFAVVGGLALGLGAKQGVEQWLFRRAALHTRGVVVGFEGASGKRRGTYYPRVRYEAPGGASVEFRSHFAYAQDEYRIGQDVDVLYDPADPETAEVDSSQSRYAVFLMPGFVLLVALAALALYTLIFFLVIRKEPAEGP